MFSWAIKESYSLWSLKMGLLFLFLLLLLLLCLFVLTRRALSSQPFMKDHVVPMIQCFYSGVVRDHFHWILSSQRWQSIFHEQASGGVLEKGEIRGHIYWPHVHTKKTLLIGELLKGAVYKIKLQFDPRMQNFSLPSTGDSAEWWDLSLHSFLEF